MDTWMPDSTNKYHLIKRVNSPKLQQHQPFSSCFGVQDLSWFYVSRFKDICLHNNGRDSRNLVCAAHKFETLMSF